MSSLILGRVKISANRISFPSEQITAYKFIIFYHFLSFLSFISKDLQLNDTYSDFYYFIRRSNQLRYTMILRNRTNNSRSALKLFV